MRLFFIGGSLEDADHSGTFVEVFLVQSWAEHLRQHERPTRADIAVRERVRAFHRGTEPPEVTHYLAVTPSSVED